MAPFAAGAVDDAFLDFGVNTDFTRAKKLGFDEFAAGAGAAAGAGDAVDALELPVADAVVLVAVALATGAVAEAQAGQPTPKHGPVLCQAQPVRLSAAAPSNAKLRRVFMVCPLRTHARMLDMIGPMSCYPV